MQPAADAAGQRVPRAHPGARGAAEVVHLAGTHVGVGIFGEHVIIAVRAGRVGAGLLEPGILVAGMVQHVVHVDVDALGLRLVDQVLEIGFRAEFRVDGGVVRHVVAVVRAASLDGRKPQRGHAQRLEVVEVLRHALEVAPAVSVGVGEAVDVELVGDIGEIVALLDGRGGPVAASGDLPAGRAGEKRQPEDQGADDEVDAFHIGYRFLNWRTGVRSGTPARKGCKDCATSR